MKYEITLESATGQQQVVHDEGIDGGMAAQAAMRKNAGWTAKHDLTRELPEDAAPVVQAEAGGSGQVNHEVAPAGDVGVDTAAVDTLEASVVAAGGPSRAEYVAAGYAAETYPPLAPAPADHTGDETPAV